MPTITEIKSIATVGLELPDLPWLHLAIGPKLASGSAYLVAGAPGIGKSTLTLQVLGALAGQGIKVLYLPTEQGLRDVKRTVDRLFGPESRPTMAENLHIDSIHDLSALSSLLLNRVLKPEGEYFGTRVIAVDSLQGAGLGSQPGGKYQELKQFIDMARGEGITSILVNHVTKTGEIGGPKTLQHEADCILFLRKASRLRALFVPKHRDHPAITDPVMLAMTDRGLDLSPHAATQTTKAVGYCGKDDEFSEAQASVSIPKYGANPALNAAFLPSKRIQQLLKIAGSLEGIEEEDFSFNVTCYIPGQRVYAPTLDLSIVTAVLGSYLRRPVPDTALFVGELDLMRQIRPPDNVQLQSLAGALGRSGPGQIKTVYIAKEAAEGLRQMRAGIGGPAVDDIAVVRGVETLEELARMLWPDVLGKDEPGERTGIAALSFEGYLCTADAGKN